MMVAKNTPHAWMADMIAVGRLQVRKVDGTYTGEALVDGLHGRVNRIPVQIAPGLLEPLCRGRADVSQFFKMAGWLRMEGREVCGKMRWSPRLVVENIRIAESGEASTTEIDLAGELCTPPVFRRTPSGTIVCEAMVRVMRNGRESRFPCVAFNANAELIRVLEVGDVIEAKGRMHSHEYTKRLDMGETVTRTGYDISLYKLY